MKKYILHAKVQFLLLSFLLILVSGLNVLSAVVMANIINVIVERQLLSFFQQLLIWLGIWVIVVLIRYRLATLETEFEQGIANQIRSDIVDAITRQNYEKYNAQDSTRFVSWMNNDVQQIVDRGLSYLYVVIEEVSSIVLSLVTLWIYNIWLMLLSVVLAVLTLLLPKLLNKKLALTSARLTKENEKFVQVASDMISSFNMLFSFNALSLMKKKINTESKSLKSAYVNQAKIYGGITALGFIGNIVSQIGVTGLSGILVINKLISIGAIYSVSSLTGNIFNGVGNLPNYISYIRSSKPIFKKFEKFIVENSDNKQGKIEVKSAEPFLTMENVTFHYPNSKKNILNNFSLKFEKNNKYFLDGDSGCGKSTILKLLAGFYPSYLGKIMFNGRQITEYSSQVLHNNIFYLDQHPQVIQGTIRENLNLSSNYSDRKLKQVLTEMHLDTSDEFLDTFVKKDGNSLSGGQLQRLALARALLRDFKVFLLDEGTTGIERETANELEQILLRDPNKTVIVVNHNETKDNMKLFNKVINLNEVHH